MRVSDAQCLAACEAAGSSSIKVMHNKAEDRIVIYDDGKPYGEKIIAKFSPDDGEAAMIRYQTECWRPIITAALNVL